MTKFEISAEFFLILTIAMSPFAYAKEATEAKEAKEATKVEDTSTVSVADLEWMSGSWVGRVGEQTLEENWTGPVDGTLR